LQFEFHLQQLLGISKQGAVLGDKLSKDSYR